MKKQILTQKQISLFFIFALTYLVLGSLISSIGTRLGYMQPGSSFANAMELKDNITFYVLIPIALLINILQLVGVLPQRKFFLDAYPANEYPKLNAAFRYSKIALGVSIFVGIVSNFIKF